MSGEPEGRYRVADLSALEDEDPRTVRIASFDDLGPAAEEWEAPSAGADPVGSVRVGSFDGIATGGTGGAADAGSSDGDAPVASRVASLDGLAGSGPGRSRARRGGSGGSGGNDAATPRTRGAGLGVGGTPGPGPEAGPGADTGPRTDTRTDTDTGTRTDTEAGDRRGRRAERRGRRGGGRAGRAGGTTGAPTEDRPATPAEQQARAKEICLRLLTDRARTVQELRDAMVRKEIPEDVADGVLERFDEVGLVDDAAFAELWVRSRHQYRGLGRRAIAVELRRKGVDSETAAEALTGIDDDAERDRARELVARRLRGLPIGSREERQATARKLVGMLARKGYGPNVAYGVVRDEIAAAGADAEEFGEEPPDEH